MIAFIQGKILHLCAPSACILTTSGVGYEVELPLSVFCELSLGDEIGLWTHLVVREDSQFLCGFLDQQDRQTFRRLIKVSGVGAKMALTMLSAYKTDELTSIIASQNEAALVKIAGVGKKTAQRLLIELQDKLTTTHTQDFALLPFEEAKSALLALGYKEKEIESVLKNAKEKTDENTTVQALLKSCLQQLSRF